MHLIQIFLPTHDNQGVRFDRALFDGVRTELAEHFGGVTTYMRAPATGIWDDGDSQVKDELVIFEVMTDRLEREFWRLYRLELQELFRQDVIMMRAQRIDVL
ncbi:MAG TPA: hypothetical protein VGD27_15455 [Longimicrobiales bacterium]